MEHKKELDGHHKVFIMEKAVKSVCLDMEHLNICDLKRSSIVSAALLCSSASTTILELLFSVH